MLTTMLSIVGGEDALKTLLPVLRVKYGRLFPEITARHFVPIPSRDRTPGSMAAHVKRFCPTWSSTLCGTGAGLADGVVCSPAMLVITHNALRAVEFAKYGFCCKMMMPCWLRTSVYFAEWIGVV
jgi:hypothetical protein